MELALTMLVLTTVDGYAVSFNPALITALRPSREAVAEQPNTVIAPGARCIVSLSDGKFIAVVEDCEAIRKRLKEIDR